MLKVESQLTIVNIRESLLKVFIILADAKSLFTLQDKVPLMKDLWKFPSDTDQVTVTQLISSFPNGNQQVRNMGISFMRFVASTEIQTFASVKATQAVFDEIQSVLLPQMQNAAKSAFQSAAKDYLSSQRAAIIATALIPIVSIEKAREKLDSAKKEAISRGTKAAKKAAEDKKKELMPLVDAKAQELTKQAVGSNKDAIKQLIKIATEDAKKKLIEK